MEEAPKLASPGISAFTFKFPELSAVAEVIVSVPPKTMYTEPPGINPDAVTVTI
jgi:hypothetical protein